LVLQRVRSGREKKVLTLLLDMLMLAQKIKYISCMELCEKTKGFSMANKLDPFGIVCVMMMRI
jgi:hypothetical protein